MAQHDYSIANQSGSSFRSDLNNALAAIVSQNSGASAPSTTFAYQTWADTTDNVLKIRNAANDGWIELYQLDGTLTIEAGTVSAPGLAFRGDLDTGIWRPAANQFAISTNAIERVEWGTSEVVFNDGGNPYDFRVEGDTDANLLLVDASADRVGVGTSTPAAKLQVRAGDSDTIAEILRLEQLNAAATDSARLIVQADAANNLVIFNSTGTSAGGYAFESGGTERVRITPAGSVTIGTSTSIPVGSATASDIQLASALGFISQTRYVASTTGPGLFLGKSRSATVGSNAIVVNGDDLGQIVFAGDDGTDIQTQAAAIRAQVDGTPGANDMPGRLLFLTTADGASTPTEAMRIDSTGRLLVGATSARANFNNTTETAAAQFEGTSVSDSSISVVRNINAAGTGGTIRLGRTRGAAVGGTTVVASGDGLGFIEFSGSDGTEFVRGATIAAEVDGTPGANDMPGRLVFATTADGAAATTERLRIASNGAWGLAGANYGTSGQVLTSNGSASAPTWETGAGITRATAVASTSGTSIDFTSIPSTVRRVTVMFNGVSTSGTSSIQIQLGTGATPTYTTSGYLGSSMAVANASTTAGEQNGTGFRLVANISATSVQHGSIQLINITGNTWTESAVLGHSDLSRVNWSGGSIALAAALTAVRITTVNGTDTFDAGTINIMYES